MMRKIGTAIVLLMWIASCDVKHVDDSIKQGLFPISKTHDKKTAEPVIKEFDFGKMKMGDSIEHTFELRNTGQAPVVIENVKASCGCTTVDWMKSPIAAGKTGWIKSRLRATDRGRLRKSVVAQLNTADPFVVFYLTGEVTSVDESTKSSLNE
ncbi:MAG TPA: DUF1573 domain-containing protein [Flavitalea sp.]|nr:DUF1573 domain-containing protein [Flavitalea sp.]